MPFTRAMAMKYREMMVRGAQSLSDADALEAPMLYPRWQANETLIDGERVYHDGVLYTVLQDHVTQDGWEPNVAPSLFAKVLIPDPEEIYEWEQPDSTNPYRKGAKVRHNGAVWESQIDGNIWEPGAIGTETLWVEV